MNSTYNSISNDFLDSFQYVIYGISVIGMVGHVINVFVLSSSELKDSSYKFMLANSINNFFYLLSVFKFFNCDQTCVPNQGTLFHLLYYIAVDEYLSSCMAIFNLLIQIFLSFQRILLVLNKKFFQNITPFKGILGISIISLIYYSPVLTIQKIELSIANVTRNSTIEEKPIYSIVSTNFGLSPFGQSIRIVLYSIRIILSTFILTILNVINYVLFKRYIKNKEKLLKKSEGKKSSNKSFIK